jgi:hypothetical protein
MTAEYLASLERAGNTIWPIAVLTRSSIVLGLARIGAALTYAGLGEMNNAFRWLENAAKERSLWIAWLAVDPRFDLFRGDPRYVSILEQMRLPPR